MAQINKPSSYFNTVLYTGNGSTQSITGVGFQPDFTWIKDRTNAYGHDLYDVIRGATNRIQSNDTGAESSASGLTSFDSDGFSLGSYVGDNSNTANYVSWNWLAGGTASSNTDGSITSSVSANTTSGFSIVSYSGNSSSATVGHGLGIAPKMIIIKHRNDVDDWTCYHASLGSSQRIQLNSTGAASSLSWGGDPTSSVFYLLGGGATAVNVTGGTYIAYCFAEKKGFSKYGSYTGNGSADGTFVYTGFKPAWVMIKISSTSGASWYISDNKRNTYNVVNGRLLANIASVESTSVNICDFTSNGFKIRTNDGGWNTSGATYIYMCFAENPLVGTNNIPATAR
jgi:hypothetical protein